MDWNGCWNASPPVPTKLAAPGARSAGRRGGPEGRVAASSLRLAATCDRKRGLRASGGLSAASLRGAGGTLVQWQGWVLLLPIREAQVW